MEVLLVGGGGDGKRVVIDEGRPFIHMRVPPDRYPVDWATSADDPPITVETELYQRERFRGEKREFIIFKHEGITIDTMVEMLIGGYRKEAKNERD